MKKILLLFTTLLIISCSKDDDTNDTSQTFTERMDGQIFQEISDNYEYYFQYLNGNINFKEVYITDINTNMEETLCLEYSVNTTMDFGDYTLLIEVLTNNFNELKLRVTENNSGENYVDVEIVTHTFSDNNITISYQDENGGQIDTEVFEKSLLTSLESVCNN